MVKKKRLKKGFLSKKKVRKGLKRDFKGEINGRKGFKEKIFKKK